MSGLQEHGGKQDLFQRLVQVLAVLAPVVAVVLGPFSDVRATWAGLALLILSAAHWAAWSRNRAVWYVRAATGLFALGSLLVIFEELSGAEAHLAGGAAVVFVLFIIAAVLRGRFPKAGNSALTVGHLTSIVLACAVLLEAWYSSLSTWYMPLAAAPFVLSYALIPGLRRNFGFRLGTALWISFVVLFCLAARADTPFWQQIPVAVYLSLAFVAGGYVLGRKGRDTAWKGCATALYACAAIFAGFCGVVSLFTPAVVDSWLMFLVNGAVFASLFMILRQDVFVYLVTLSLALMAYSWVKASTSVFTQDIMFYLVIGAAMLGAFFSLPHLKRLLVRTGSLPVFGIFSLRGKLLMAIPGAGLALLVLSAYSLKLTSHPKFCSSCHNMDEYYSSWQHSSHRDVACVECHFEPGPTAMMAGKLAGLVQVVKYVSHSYAPKPHAVISNKSCMRPGDCHAEMDHSKETLLFRGRIRFRHDKHLGSTAFQAVDGHSLKGRATMTLNCVSCHGYTGQGEHISVTKTTCLTCHFYVKESKPAAGKQSDYGTLRRNACTTCHRLPQKPVKFMGQEFSHQKFLKDKENVQCTHCHNQVTQGDGAISTTRCRSCHQDKPMEVGDQVQFHLVHVSEGHFDCLQCHDEIKHGIHPMEQQLLASGNCKSCHSGERHTLQERIYAGTAMQPSLEDMPDPMYKAGVSCGGCHTEVRNGGLGTMPFTKKFSGPKQCVDCHSRKKVNVKDVGKAKYGKMLVGWQEDTKDRIEEYQPELKKLQAELDKLAKAAGSARPLAEELAKAKERLAFAQTKLTYIVKDGSLGAHNFPYVSEALDSVEEDVEKCQSFVLKWQKAAGGSP